MEETDAPWDEMRRLGALRAAGLLDTPPEERFDRVTRLAQRLFRVPIALISLVDEDRQWFKSHQGLAINLDCSSGGIAVEEGCAFGSADGHGEWRPTRRRG